MTKTVIVAIASGVAGIFIGLYIADKYAQYKATSTVNAGLDKLGIGGAAPFVDPIVAGLI